MRHAVVAAVAIALLFPAASRAAEVWEEPQIKVDRIEADNPPSVRLYVTFLDKRKKPVPIDQVETLEVTVRRERERPEKVVTFSAGVPPKGTDASFLPRGKTGSSLGVVMVVPATFTALGMSTLEQSVYKAAASFFKSLGGADRANFLWYADHLHTYIPTTGKTRELSDLTKRYEECKQARVDVAEARARQEDEVEPETDGTLVALGREACGLVSTHAELPAIIEVLGRPRSYYPHLFGLDDSLDYCREVPLGHEKERTPEEVGATPAPTMSEALEMLVRTGHDLSARALVLVSDGRDGYLFRRDDCRAELREVKCPQIVPGKDTDADVEERRVECVTKGMSELIRREQVVFADKAGRWLALARAAGVTIHAVGLRTGLAGENEFELDRLRVLALQTGGTYRQADEPGEVYEQIMNLADELSGQYVIEVSDAGLSPGETVTLSVRAEVAGGASFDSIEPYEVETGTPVAGAEGLVKRWFGKLADKVGFVWAVVIVSVVALILLVLVVLLLRKMVKAIIKGVQGKAKAAAGQAKGAATKAAKGAAGGQR